jgi:quercetin dioxygenase-like cupin family protein
MKVRPILAAVTLFAAAGLLSAAVAQGVGLHRTDLLDRDLSVPGRRAVQVRVDFDPGSVSIRHRHPGEEIAYVLEGTLEYQLAEAPAVSLRAGQSLFIPAGVPHIARNVGPGRASELATYIVRKGQPIVSQVE